MIGHNLAKGVQRRKRPRPIGHRSVRRVRYGGFFKEAPLYRTPDIDQASIREDRRHQRIDVRTRRLVYSSRTSSLGPFTFDA